MFLGSKAVRASESCFHNKSKIKTCPRLASVVCSLHRKIQAHDNFTWGGFNISLLGFHIHILKAHRYLPNFDKIIHLANPLGIFGGKEMNTAKTFGIFSYNTVFQCNILMWIIYVIVLINFDQIGIR